MAIIDAQGAVVGRLGARVAKLLLSGQQVEIINAESAVMLGSLPATKKSYLSRRSQQNKRDPDESPKWPRSPHLFLRRIIRGMLPFRSQRGRDAYHRLRVSIGAGANGKAAGQGKKQEKPQKIIEASSEEKHRKFTLEELCVELGYRKANQAGV